MPVGKDKTTFCMVCRTEVSADLDVCIVWVVDRLQQCIIVGACAVSQCLGWRLLYGLKLVMLQKKHHAV